MFSKHCVPAYLSYLLKVYMIFGKQQQQQQQLQKYNNNTRLFKSAVTKDWIRFQSILPNQQGNKTSYIQEYLKLI